MDKLIYILLAVSFSLLIFMGGIETGRYLQRQAYTDTQRKIDIINRGNELNGELEVKEYPAIITIDMEVKTTGYCNNKICINNPLWQDGMTASNTIAKVGTCAADWKVIPKGTVIYIDGYGLCKIQDKGGKVRGKHIDLFFNSYQEAKAWGVQVKTVKVFL